MYLHFSAYVVSDHYNSYLKSANLQQVGSSREGALLSMQLSPLPCLGLEGILFAVFLCAA